MDFNRTKIIATIGPSCSSPEVLRKLVAAGMNVARLNFSHGEYDVLKNVIFEIHKINEEGNNVAILADLQGPKLRVGRMPEGGVELIAGEHIVITNEEVVGNKDRFTLRYAHLTEDLTVGERILLDDGKLEVVVVEPVANNAIRAKVIRGGFLQSNKGFNLPGNKISMPAITDKDKKDLEFIFTQDIDWIALSFVRKAEDVIELKRIIDENNKDFKVIAKIEKPEAIDHIDEIIEQADAIMIARGDLGIEMPLQELPLLQKSIIQKCNALAKPSIVATQMMESMIDNTIPSRAEVSDVANAVIDGADAIMLSGETSIGKYPVLTVATMHKIVSDVEKDDRPYNKGLVPTYKTSLYITNAICYTATEMSKNINAEGIVTMTQSGYSARKISSYRPKCRLFVFSNNKHLLRTLSLVWGIQTFFYDNSYSTDQTISDTDEILKNNNFIKKGDVVIHTASMPIEKRGFTNSLKISMI